MASLITQLRSTLAADQVLEGEQIGDDYTHDECLNLGGNRPAALVRPSTTAEVSAILRLCQEHRVAVTVRGSGTGLSGGCIPAPDGILLSTERMKRIVEVDLDNHIAVVQPGVTLGELDEATRPHGLTYPIQPGEASASLGGNVATNAGGMRAVKYGVTRNQVLGLQVVLAGGDVVDCGGKFVKASSGYDLTQLVIGSEGTLGVVTEITVKLVPRLTHRQSLLAPFENVEQITRAVPKIVQSGVGPLFVEYLDALSMAGVLQRQKLELGIPEAVRSRALAYLLIVVESTSETRNQEDVEQLGQLCVEQGACDVYVLPKNQAGKVIQGREESFWAGKAAGLSDQVDVVVPRAQLATFMAESQRIASETASLIVGTGHAGDGNVHLGIFQPDEAVRTRVMNAIFDASQKLGGIVSAEHGIGLAKKKYYNAREQPAKLALMRRIKLAFDPYGIMNPGKVFDLDASEHERRETLPS
jgi:glycolate oxidase